MAHEIAELVARAVVGGEPAIVPPEMTVLPSGVKLKDRWLSPFVLSRLMEATARPSFEMSRMAS